MTGVQTCALPIFIIPKDNFKNLEDLPNDVKKGLKFITVKNLDEVLQNALTRNPF